MLHSQSNIDSDNVLMNSDHQDQSQFLRKSKASKSCPPQMRRMKIKSIRLKNQFLGFKNEIWRDKSLNILVLVIRFIGIITGTIFSQTFRLMNKKMFRIIGDKAADFSFYRMANCFKYDEKPETLNRLSYDFQNTYLRNFEKYRIWKLITSKKSTLIPESLFVLFWNIFLMIMINLSLFYISAKFAFSIDFRPSQYHEIRQILFYKIPFFTFILDIFLKFHISFYEKGHLVDDRLRIIKHYFKTSFTFDILVVLSQILYIYGDIVNLDILIIIKILQIPNISGQLLDKLELTTKHLAIYDLIRLFYLIIIEAHFCSCGWFYIGSTQQTDNWISNQNLGDKDWVEQYFHTFYWSIITMSTIGYGDIVPQNLRERVFLIFIALFSCCTFGYSIGSIGQIFGQLSAKSNQIRIDMNSLKKYLRVKGYNADLQIKIRRYFEYIWNDIQQDESLDLLKFYEQLPSYLQNEMIIDLNMRSIRKIEFFQKNFDDNFLSQLATKFVEEKYAPEQQIFLKDTQSEYLYILCEGSVEYYFEIPDRSSNIISLSQFHNRDEPFGQIEFFLDGVYQMNCRSIESTRVIKVSRTNFQEIAKICGMEQYCQFKDKLKFSGRLDVLHIQCEGCKKSTHILQNCPMITGFPNKSKLLLTCRKNYLNDRHFYQRTNYFRRIHSLSHENDISDSVICYLLNDKQKGKQIEKEYQIETIKNSKLKRLKPVQLKRTSKFSFRNSIKPSFLQNLHKMKLKESVNISQQLTPLQEISESESIKIGEDVGKSIIIQRLINARQMKSESITEVIEEQQSYSEESEKNQDPFQMAIQISQTNITSQDINNIFQKNDASITQNQVGLSMGKYKDIFEDFDKIQHFEKYMSHMNLGSQIRQQDVVLERKTFQRFLRTNMTNKKRARLSLLHLKNS